MLLDNFRLLANYNRWMNERLYTLAAQLPVASVFEDKGAFFGSIFGTFSHLLVADILWLKRIAQHSRQFHSLAYIREHTKPSALNELIHPDLASLHADRAQVDATIVALLAELDEASLALELDYSDLAGNTYRHSLALILQHVFNHQTHHRGQVTTLFYQAGSDPGVTDLMYLIRNP